MTLVGEIVKITSPAELKDCKDFYADRFPDQAFFGFFFSGGGTNMRCRRKRTSASSASFSLTKKKKKGKKRFERFFSSMSKIVLKDMCLKALQRGALRLY